jgi:hypothetical protein
MKDKLRRCAPIIGPLVFASLLGACASSQAQKGATIAIRSPAADKTSVRKVDFSRAPELKDLAERARSIGNEMYPSGAFSEWLEYTARAKPGAAKNKW